MIQVIILLTTLLIFVSFAIPLIHMLILENKLKYIDELVGRGANIDDVLR